MDGSAGMADPTARLRTVLSRCMWDGSRPVVPENPARALCPGASCGGTRDAAASARPPGRSCCCRCGWRRSC
jgi:hypothetical protein